MSDSVQRPFADRRDAGRVLASRLAAYANRPDVIVLALPRGGVPVGFEVATALHVRMDVFLVRKLGAPGHRELAMGAIASGGIRVLNDEVVSYYRIAQPEIENAAKEEEQELRRREQLYRRARPAAELSDRSVVIIDDGLATGSTMRAAVLAVKTRHPARVIVAVPVGAPQTCAELSHVADEVVCVHTPEPFSSVGQWYEDFEQTDDTEVQRLLSAPTLL